MLRFLPVLAVALVAGTACSAPQASPPASGTSARQSATATPAPTATATVSRLAAGSCADSGHGISATFTNSTGHSNVTMQTTADGKTSNPFVIGSGQSWTGTSPYNCDSSTYASVSLKIEYALYTWHNNWVSVQLYNVLRHSPNLRVCSLLGQGTEVWCDSFDGMLPGETQTMKPRTTSQGAVVGVVTVVRKPDTDANSQYEITATCPDSGCTWVKPG